MNIIITAPTAESLVDQLSTGTAQVHSEREDGTLRRRHFLADGTDARADAEWVRLQRTGQEADENEGVVAVAPRSMGSIALELHVSVAHVRRMLIDLAITEELEEADEAELAAWYVGEQEEGTN